MEIEWRPEALNELSDILDYLLETGGKRTAVKFANNVDATIVRLASQPNIGPVEISMEELSYEYRSVVEGKNHKIIYRIEKEKIHILVIWDCRQNPETLNKEVTKRK